MAHTAGFHDGLGERRSKPGTGHQVVDLLILREAFGAVPGFEAALRERVTAMSGFHHGAFARVHAVGRVAKAQSRLVVASDRVEGVRLAEMLAVAEQRLIPLVFDASLGLLHQLVHAMAALHDALPDASHGALGPERLIVTPDGRLIVTEYVCAPALEQLQYTPERYWRELRIPLVPGNASPRLDRRADVAQLGAVALALTLGRPLGEDEYPDRIADIVSGVRAISASGLDVLPQGMRQWLRRALQLDPRVAFGSAIEAAADFQQASGIDEPRSREALAAFLAQYHRAVSPEPQDEAPAITAPAAPAPAEPRAGEPGMPAMLADGGMPPMPAPVTLPMPGAMMPVLPAAQFGAPPPADDEAPPASFAAPGEALPDVLPIASPSAMFAGLAEREEDDVDETFADHEDHAPAGRGLWRGRVAAAAAILIALTTAGAFAARSYVRGPATGTLIVNTDPAGVEVSIDGEPRGATPLTVELTPGDHLLEVAANGQTRSVPVSIAAGDRTAQFIEVPKSAPETGQLHVRTDPAGAAVTVDGERRGQSPLVVGGLAPGTHTVVLENALGSVTERVTIEPGVTAALVVPLNGPKGAPVSGWVSVTAPVELQVFEGGRLLGSTRLDRIMMAVGRHELEIRNDTLGYRQTRVVEVTPGRVTPIRLDVPRGSLAVNATPWADVWVNGQHVGETPIGHVELPIGTHDVLFRHPELGEYRQTVTVTLAGPARVSADLRRRP